MFGVCFFISQGYVSNVWVFFVIVKPINTKDLITMVAKCVQLKALQGSCDILTFRCLRFGARTQTVC